MQLSHPSHSRWVNFLEDILKKGMIFIDGSNVYFDWANANPGKQLDIEKYINVVKSKYPDVEFKRTYYFTSETPTNKNFIQQINKIPYVETICGHLQNKNIDLSKFSLSCSCGQPISGTATMQVDKGTDVNIAVEMLKHAYNHTYEIALLISRDADFVGVINIIKDLGCNVELVLFEGSKSHAQELSKYVDDIKLISKAEYSSCEK